MEPATQRQESGYLLRSTKGARADTTNEDLARFRYWRSAGLSAPRDPSGNCTKPRRVNRNL